MTDLDRMLPFFKYHPDPVATGSLKRSNATCLVCQRATGWVYESSVYATAELEGQLCPWCIADGSAHRSFDASFTDESGIGGYGDWDAVPESVIEEVAFRTPGFSGWQQEMWWTHCGDAAAYLGPAGHRELLAYGPQAIAAIRESAGIEGEAEWIAFLNLLHAENGPTAYLFRCLHCGELGGYQDCH